MSAQDVRLVPTKGTKGRGGGADGEAWRIEHKGRRAGQVFINRIDQPPVGPHASIQIYLNQTSQGRGIGRLGYHLACSQSRYDVIYAHMQKSNLASARAAEAAGFVDAALPEERQRLLVWRRQSAPASVEPPSSASPVTGPQSPATTTADQPDHEQPPSEPQQS
ncbi:hypothetical protein HNR47_000935 [Methylopila jiangsuensis]|uniref:GNAT family N-acetyltransferase n=1 Tax=Methylopila jiangsuensis TaxID=586230 RepID=UPI0022F2DB2A|nr:GNAT family N-acetyltransferase [Methylopila jiangsuensis]MDR6284952.1 hypothetical protein [Methylopila jiangsuensis]